MELTTTNEAVRRASAPAEDGADNKVNPVGRASPDETETLKNCD